MSKELTTYKPTGKDIELFNVALILISTKGIGINKACKEIGMCNDAFYKTMYSDDLHKDNYMRACAQRAMGMAEQTIDIYADVEPLIEVNGMMQQNTIGLQKARCIADSLKWYASKLNPLLADKTSSQVAIAINTKPIIINIGDNSQDLTEYIEE